MIFYNNTSVLISVLLVCSPVWVLQNFNFFRLIVIPGFLNNDDHIINSFPVGSSNSQNIKVSCIELLNSLFVFSVKHMVNFLQVVLPRNVGKLISTIIKLIRTSSWNQQNCMALE